MCQLLGDCEDIPGVSKVSSGDSERAKADAIASDAVVLDLALVEAASGNARRVTVDNGGGNVVRVDTRLGDGVGDNETTLRVTAECDLGAGAVGLGLLDELRHHRAATAAHLSVAGDRGRVVHALDCDAVGSERFLEGGGQGGTDGGTEVLGIVSMSFCW